MSDAPIWTPDPARARRSQVARFITRLRAAGHDLPDSADHAAFDALHRWSVQHPDLFWSEFWRDSAVIADQLPNGEPWSTVLIGGDHMAPPDPVQGPRWFDGARLNFAENLLRRDDNGDALVTWDERGRGPQWSWASLRRDVARVTAALGALGVQPGDRVAGWLPNIGETVIAMLATAALGAVWTSCSPDFGNDGIVDRFGQTEPVVLIFCDGYGYGGRAHPCNDRADALLARLPSVRHAVMIHCRGDDQLPSDSRAQHWRDLLAAHPDTPLTFCRLPFDHPLYVLYSSGTTGLPKAIIHSAGGAFLQLLKEHRLHVDLHLGERLFYFTTCGWMMWNWQVNALAAGATLVLYDGAPLPAPDPGILWRLAAEERVTVFGTSAKYLAIAEKEGLRPQRDYDLRALRCVLSTGSPLAAESFDWVQRNVGAQVQTASISGGTDIISCFMLGNPLSPVYRGELQGPGLGLALDIFAEDGTSAPIGAPGELVCTKPFPSMPIGFWNDADGARYRAAYFEDYPGVWRHGDWVTRTASGGFVISGRSDATLNPGGVRIGTAEVYRQVEAIDEVVESLVIGQRRATAGIRDERIVLFVRLRDGITLDATLEQAIRRRIRAGTSPHHVPKIIMQVADIPRTRSGKSSELAVRDVIEGRAVKNVGALANPEALDEFRTLAEGMQ